MVRLAVEEEEVVFRFLFVTGAGVLGRVLGTGYVTAGPVDVVADVVGGE